MAETAGPQENLLLSDLAERALDNIEVLESSVSIGPTTTSFDKVPNSAKSVTLSFPWHLDSLLDLKIYWVASLKDKTQLFAHICVWQLFMQRVSSSKNTK